MTNEAARVKLKLNAAAKIVVNGEQMEDLEEFVDQGGTVDKEGGDS